MCMIWELYATISYQRQYKLLLSHASVSNEERRNSIIFGKTFFFYKSSSSTVEWEIRFFFNVFWVSYYISILLLNLSLRFKSIKALPKSNFKTTIGTCRSSSKLLDYRGTLILFNAEMTTHTKSFHGNV